jgi:putative peptide zinc metalloprotease protein
MEHYPTTTRVLVRPFAQHREGDTVTIGDPDRQVFLSIPEEGVDILNWLAEGQTIGETSLAYEQKYGDTPDIEDFLDALADEGFVVVGSDAPHDDDLAPSGATLPRSHLSRISPAFAARLCGPPVLVGCAALILGALALIGTDPGVVPGPSVLVFPHYLAAVSLGLFVFGLAGVAVHEVGHLIAARAAGVPARFGLSHRLWILVAETDLTGMWLAPKRKRYLAFLAGPLIDAISASALVGFLWAHRHGWFALSPMLTQLAGAGLMVYLLRLLWQCFFFVRTDFYYVFASAFSCKNLLGDTETFMHNAVARVLRSRPTVDQSDIPADEMRVVRLYAVIWLLGRALAFGSLFLITLPVMWRYGTLIAPMLVGRHSRYGLLDVFTLATVTIGVEGAGLVLWVRTLVRARIGRSSGALAAS